MTVIVGCKHDGVVYLGCDSTVTNSYSQSSIKSVDNAKIQKMPNDVFVGSAGRVTAIQELTLSPHLFQNIPQDGISKEFLIKNIVTPLHKVYKENKLLDDEGRSLCEFLIAHKDKLFVITDQFGVFQVETDYAIGSGTYSALCVMRQTDAPIKQRILNALQMAAKVDKGVGAPFVMVDTKELQYQSIN